MGKKVEKKLEKRFYITFKHQMVWMISTALGIAAALFWKDTFTEIANAFMPKQTLASSVYISALFTLIAAFIIWLLHEIFKE